jgi:hypothetical protein
MPQAAVASGAVLVELDIPAEKVEP